MTTVDRPPEKSDDQGDIPLKPRAAPEMPLWMRMKPDDAPSETPAKGAGKAAARKPPASFAERVGRWVRDFPAWMRGALARMWKGGEAPGIAPRPWKIAEEPAWGKWVAGVIVLTGLAMFAYVVQSYYAGAHGGVDQNAYHRTAELIADHHAIGWRQSDPYEFAGKMDVIVGPDGNEAVTPEGGVKGAATQPEQVAGAVPAVTGKNDPPPFMTYAKYPFGYPLLGAIGRWFIGFEGMYWVNPICTVIAVGFSYLMFRQVLRRFTSIVGAALLACNPLTLFYANDGNSHASTLMCVCVGFWALMSWMRTHSWWRGMLGGFFLGYACTVRFSEFLLVLPVGFAALMSLAANGAEWWRKRKVEGARGAFRWRAMMDWAFPVVGWLIPVAALALVCHFAFGGWGKNGYTYCNEDTGFEWRFLIYGAIGAGRGGFGASQAQGNWETLVLALNRTGLFVMWPMALVGLVGMLGKLPRVGLTVAAWVLPSIFLYMLYYWAPTQETGLGYLRFFVSVLPGLLLAGLWLVEKAMDAIEGSNIASLWVVTAFAALAFVVCAWMMLDYDKKYMLDGDEKFLSKTIQMTGWAIWAMWKTPLGWGITLALAGLLAGIWIRERDVAGRRAGLAVALGIGAMLACGMNLMTEAPQLESSHANWTAFRQLVDVVSDKAPSGSVLFADERLCQQLDGIGPYRVYSTNVFAVGGGGGGFGGGGGGGRNGRGGGGGLLGGFGGGGSRGGGSALFASSEQIVNRHDKKVEIDGDADPNPYQYERALYYMQLFGKPIYTKELVKATPDEARFNQVARVFGVAALPVEEKVTTSWESVGRDEVLAAEMSRWEKAYAEGRRVFYVFRDSQHLDPQTRKFVIQNSDEVFVEASRRGYRLDTVAAWNSPEPPTEAQVRLGVTNQRGGRGGRAFGGGGGGGAPAGRFGGGGGGGFGRGGGGGTWIVVEVKAPGKTTPTPVNPGRTRRNPVTPAPVVPVTPPTPTPTPVTTSIAPAAPARLKGPTIFDWD